MGRTGFRREDSKTQTRRGGGGQKEQIFGFEASNAIASVVGAYGGRRTAGAGGLEQVRQAQTPGRQEGGGALGKGVSYRIKLCAAEVINGDQGLLCPTVSDRYKHKLCPVSSSSSRSRTLYVADK